MKRVGLKPTPTKPTLFVGAGFKTARQNSIVKNGGRIGRRFDNNSIGIERGLQRADALAPTFFASP